MKRVCSGLAVGCIALLVACAPGSTTETDGPTTDQSEVVTPVTPTDASADTGTDPECEANQDCETGYCDAGACAPCTGPGQCDDGQFCDTASGQCTMLFELGDACDQDDRCGSGLCVDAVCCDAVCDGACLACSISAGGVSDGTCTPAFVDSVEPGVCDVGVGACGDDACACDDEGTCVPDFVAQVSVGGRQVCARTAVGEIKCWGHNLWGQLGQEDKENRGDEPGEMGKNLPPVDLGEGLAARAVEAGDSFICAILVDGSVRCWGNGGLGRLGQESGVDVGDTEGSMGDALVPTALGTSRTASSLQGGGGHACAVLDDQTLKCWGDNRMGQLGLGDTDFRGHQKGTMGDALPAVDLGTGRSVVQVDAGYRHTCVVLDDGTVKCWGDNGSGQLGLGDAEVRGDAPGEMGDALPVVDLGSGRTARQVAVGGFSSCALLDDGTVKCWGDNYDGTLGLGDTNARGDEPGEMGDALATVDLGTGRTATGLAMAFGSVCALLDDGSVRCWGANGSGQLGLGDTEARGDDPGELGDKLPTLDVGGPIEDLSGYSSVFCALLTNEQVKCWGANQVAQLGLGDKERRGDDPGEMGQSLPAVDLW